MPEQPTKPNALLAAYPLKGAPAQFVGLVHNAPDEPAAIAKTIEEYKAPENQRGWLIAQRQD